MSNEPLWELINGVNDLRARVEELETAAIRNYGCAFLAINTVTDANQTGNGATATVDFDTEIYDLGDNFAGDTFTAKATGTYPLYACVELDDLTAAMTYGRIQIVTSNRTYYGNISNWGAQREVGNAYSAQIAASCDMDATDTATVQVVVLHGAGDTASIVGNAAPVTWFCGFRIA